MLHRHLFKNRANCCSAAMIVMFVISGAAHGGGVLYVDDDAPPGGNGTSWNTAYRFLQDAMTDAGGGGIAEIRVGQGTYKPDRDEANPDGTGDREATFQLLNGVALMGGYAGFGAKNPDDRDIDLYETILTGDLLGDDGLGDFQDNVENSYNVTTGSGTDGTAVLDGFSVTAGNADGPGGGEPNWVRGGGMYNNDSSPTVTNCTFEGNSASGNSFGGHGGAIYNANSSPFVTDCVFDGNAAISTGSSDFNAHGGAVHNTFSDPIFTNCTFVNNSATGIASNLGRIGGGMFNDASSPTITACTFELNFAQLRAGGMANVSGSSPTITNCAFTENFTDPATGLGGGGMINANSSNPTVEDCTFTGNSAGLGGGMENFNSSPTIVNCQFIGNITKGHFQGGGGMLSSTGSSPTITNCLFSGNMAGSGIGGGVATVVDAITTITNCTFSGNMADDGGGGVATAIDAITTITNCTFSDNTAPSGAGIFTTDALGGHSDTTVVNTIAWCNNPDQIRATAGATTTVDYSDVQGGWFGAGANNIDADPMFVAPGSGDYRLMAGSPCIDAGNNWGVAVDELDYDGDGVLCELFPVDLDSSPRFNADEVDFDPGCGVPVVVDMGAYEYQFDPVDQVTFADLNGDDTVGAADLLGLLVGWGPCAKGCCLADFDLDGNVGATDLLTLLVNWGPCP